MRRCREVFVGIDTAKARNAAAIADAGRQGEVRYLGEFHNPPDALAELVRKLGDRYETLHFCYEAGPTGYGLYRQILAMGHGCTVAAPSLGRVTSIRGGGAARADRAPPEDCAARVNARQWAPASRL